MNDKLLRPILPTKNHLSLTSNVLEQNITSHPIILFMDELNNYWYLKCRSATAHKNSNVYKPVYHGEILIHKNQDNDKLFWNDTYVDTSHLFYINTNDFEYLVNKYHNNFIFSDELSHDYEDLLYKNVIRNLKDIPPSISIIKTSLEKDPDIISFYTEYANLNLFNIEYRNYFNNLKEVGTSDLDLLEINRVKRLKNDINQRNISFKSELEGILTFVNNYYSEILYNRTITNKTFTL